MKLNRKYLYFYILSIIIITNSCRYKEGPEVSCRSAQNRLEGLYNIKKILINGYDYTQKYKDTCNCQIIFIIDSYVGLDHCKTKLNIGFSEGGVYEFSNNSKNIQTQFHDYFSHNSDSIYGYGPLNYGITTNWDIIRLTNKEVTLETTYQNKKYRLELVEFNL
jgi:hypothetical protein